MKVEDIKIGRRYVIPDFRSHRLRTLARESCEEGQTGIIIKVLGVGSYYSVAGECGRREIKPAPGRSDIRVWAQHTENRNGENITVDSLYKPNELLLPATEWEDKHRAAEQERRRVVAAVKAHDAQVEDVEREIDALLPTGGQWGYDNRSRRRRGSRWEYDDVPTIRFDLSLLEQMAGQQLQSTLIEKFQELHRLKSMTREEITC